MLFALSGRSWFWIHEDWIRIKINHWKITQKNTWAQKMNKFWYHILLNIMFKYKNKLINWLSLSITDYVCFHVDWCPVVTFFHHFRIFPIFYESHHQYFSNKDDNRKYYHKHEHDQHILHVIVSNRN